MAAVPSVTLIPLGLNILYTPLSLHKAKIIFQGEEYEVELRGKNPMPLTEELTRIGLEILTSNNLLDNHFQSASINRNKIYVTDTNGNDSGISHNTETQNLANDLFSKIDPKPASLTPPSLPNIYRYGISDKDAKELIPEDKTDYSMPTADGAFNPKKLARIKLMHKASYDQLLEYCNTNQWEQIRQARCALWLHPGNRRVAPYDYLFAVNEEEVELLKEDKDFMERLEQSAHLIAFVWGFDLDKGTFIKDHDLKWDYNFAHLNILANSLKVFGFKNLFKNLQFFGETIKGSLPDWLKTTLDLSTESKYDDP